MGKRQGIKLTKSEIVKLQPQETLFRVWDTEERGLGIQVTPGGVYSWVFSYRVHSRKDMLTLGRWPTMGVDHARKAAREARHKLDDGIDPKRAKAEARMADQEARRAAITMKNLATRYEEEHVQTGPRKHGQEALRLIEKHILPELGDLPIVEVGPADISALLHKMRHTPTQANRTRGVLRTMFGRAEEWGLRPLGSNPVVVVKVRNPETARTRRLSDLEIKALGEAMKTSGETPEMILGIRLALLAGMRKGEILGLLWKQVDLEAAEIRIPPDQHKGGRKTGKTRVVHLCSALVEDLRCLSQTLGCPFVIPGSQVLDRQGRPVLDEAGRPTWKPFTALQNPWERIRVAAKFAKKGEPSEEDPRIHDLRRTFASVGTDLGLKGFVGELLGHAEETVTDIYTRAAAERLQEAAETIGARIVGILSGAIDPKKEIEERRKAAKVQPVSQA